MLIVDDHEGFRDAARSMLEAEGFDVVGEAGDAEGALVEVERLRPQVVLVDIQLPGLDGFAVAYQLVVSETSKRVSRTPNLRNVGARRRGFEL